MSVLHTNLPPEDERATNGTPSGTCSGGSSERPPEPFCSEVRRLQKAGRQLGITVTNVEAHEAILQRTPPPEITWRDVDRICIPGMLLSRAVGAVIRPLVMAGPELAKRLEPHVERLDDISDRSWSQNLMRSVMHWLLRAPNSAPHTTEETPGDDPSWPSSDPARMALLKEMPELLSDRRGSGLSVKASDLSAKTSVPCERLRRTDPGVH